MWALVKREEEFLVITVADVFSVMYSKEEIIFLLLVLFLLVYFWLAVSALFCSIVRFTAAIMWIILWLKSHLTIASIYNCKCKLKCHCDYFYINSFQFTKNVTVNYSAIEQGPNPESGFSENSELFKPKFRETPSFHFLKQRSLKLWLSHRGNLLHETNPARWTYPEFLYVSILLLSLKKICSTDWRTLFLEVYVG